MRAGQSVNDTRPGPAPRLAGCRGAAWAASGHRGRAALSERRARDRRPVRRTPLGVARRRLGPVQRRLGTRRDSAGRHLPETGPCLSAVRPRPSVAAARYASHRAGAPTRRTELRIGGAISRPAQAGTRSGGPVATGSVDGHELQRPLCPYTAPPRISTPVISGNGRRSAGARATTRECACDVQGRDREALDSGCMPLA